MKYFVISFALVVLCLCSCRKENTSMHTGGQDLIESSDLKTENQDTLNKMRDEYVSNESDAIKQPEVVDVTNTSESKITAEMAYEGVSNYCHSEYDWSVVEDNGERQSSNTPIMYVKMGKETKSEFQVIFRSYTGAFVYFYVDKKSGTTRLVEYVPTLDIENEAGTINVFDYLEKKN